MRRFFIHFMVFNITSQALEAICNIDKCMLIDAFNVLNVEDNEECLRNIVTDKIANIPNTKYRMS